MIKNMLIKFLITAMVNTAAAGTAAGAAQTPTLYTAYTPNGAAVGILSTDGRTYDDDKVVAVMDDSAELYIWEAYDAGRTSYDLYSPLPNGCTLHLMMNTNGTLTIEDDFVVDWEDNLKP